jgi:hypothetical protein
MAYVIAGIDPAPLERFFGRSDGELADLRVVRVTADKKPGFPCRVTLEDAEPGEDLLLLNYEHLPVDTPYRSCHAIYVRVGARERARFGDAVPEQLRSRLLSVRAFDAHGMMIDADVIEGVALDRLIARFFGDPAVEYLHVHNAKRGCFAAEVRRS